jgi:hypothetical protein
MTATAHACTDITRRRVLLAVVLLLAAALVQTAAADLFSDAKTGSIPPSAPQKTNAAIMKEYGAQLMQNAPAEVREGTSLQKAQYAFTAYANRLSEANTPVNANLGQRALHFFTSAEPTRWTCGDHTQNIMGLFEGAGISPQNMLQIEADSNSYLPTPNSNHGALAIRDTSGKAYVFDAWGMAVSNLNAAGNPVLGNAGSSLYSGAGKSEWNGMSLEDWGTTMNEAGYTRYSADGESTWDQTAFVAVNNYFANHPESVSYPTSFTFVLSPSGTGTGQVALLLHAPITVEQGGKVSARYQRDGTTPYIRDYSSQKTTLADLSVSGTYDSKTGKIQGTFTSHRTSVTPSLTYDEWAEGSFTGQVNPDGKTMRVELHCPTYYYTTDQGRSTRYTGDNASQTLNVALQNIS